MREFFRKASGLAGDILAAALAVAAAAASFAGTDDAAYLFPRLIGAAWLGLCVLYFALRLADAAKKAGGERRTGADFAAMRRAAPGVGVIVIYVALAEAAGFYLSAFFAFLALSTIYDRRGGRRRMIARIVVACVIILALRAVFSELLRVQTPSGVLF